MRNLQWIAPLNASPSLEYWRFKREFKTVNIEDFSLIITADSRYECLIDGKYLGFGPVRGWPKHWHYDEYKITLEPGWHIIEVLVRHFRVGNFQYIVAPMGLALRLECASFVIESDEKFSVRPELNFLSNVARISCQQPHEEQFDARIKAADWNDAVVIEPPHPKVTARPIAFLTDNELIGKLIRVDKITGCDAVFGLDLREYINSSSLDANVIEAELMVGLFLDSPTDQEVVCWESKGLAVVEWKFQGENINFDLPLSGGIQNNGSKLKLKAGRNLLLGKIGRLFHHSTISLAFWWSADAVKGAWKVAGPFAWDDSREAGMQLLLDFYVTRPFVRANPITDELLESYWVHNELPHHLAVDGVNLSSSATAVFTDKTMDSLPLNYEINGVESARYLLDFGNEYIGFWEFEVEVNEGCIIDLLGFEFIQQDGRFNLSEGMNNSMRYIAKAGKNYFRSTQRRGLRYMWLSLRNLTQGAKINFIRIRESVYPQSEVGKFHSSSDILNRIFEVSRQSLRCCSEDTYTDCPAYEQVLWVGDARNESAVDLLFNTDARLSAFSLRLAAQSLERSKLVESQIPSAWTNIIPAWSFFWMRWIEEHWMATGDDAFGLEMIAYVEIQINNLKSFINKDGVIEIEAWNFFDWAPMDARNSGVVTHQNCLAVQALRQISSMASKLGRVDLAGDWILFADQISDSVNNLLFDEERNAYIDSIHSDNVRSNVISQQTQVAALISNVAAGERAKRCRDIVFHKPEHVVSAGSPFFMGFLLEIFAQDNNTEGMIQLISEYWGRQVNAGATTFWECYQEDSDRLTRSHCHAWSAIGAYFLSKYVLGVKAVESGFKTLSITPDCNLTWCEGVVPTPQGAINVRWQRVDGTYKITASSSSAITVVFAGNSRKRKILSGECILNGVKGSLLIWEEDVS